MIKYFRTGPNQCVRASVATLLQKPPQEVPDFNDIATKQNISCMRVLGAWLNERNYQLVLSDCDIQPKEEYYLGLGSDLNLRGKHCVVMRNGEIWHDPTGAGIKTFDIWAEITKS